MTISEALGAAQGYWGLDVEIRLAPGVYRERLVITQPRISLIGEGAPAEVCVSWGDGAFEILPDGIKRGTFRTATVYVEGADFRAENLSIANTAGPGSRAGQALALYLDCPRSHLVNCRLLGHQDTLFLAPLPLSEKEKGGFTGPGEHRPRRMGRHRFTLCYIEGDVDFIFGGARAWFEDCEIRSLDRGEAVNGYVTAPCTPAGEAYGFVFKGCRFTSDCPAGTVYLGRPWREDAKTAVLDCDLGAHIHPRAFHDWNKAEAHDRADFILSGSRGPGAAALDPASFVRSLLSGKAGGVEEITAEAVLGPEEKPL